MELNIWLYKFCEFVRILLISQFYGRKDLLYLALLFGSAFWLDLLIILNEFYLVTSDFFWWLDLGSLALLSSLKENEKYWLFSDAADYFIFCLYSINDSLISLILWLIYLIVLEIKSMVFFYFLYSILLWNRLLSLGCSFDERTFVISILN
jgi:hypothetical protein